MAGMILSVCLACQSPEPSPFQQFQQMQTNATYDLLIHGGTVIDGTGQLGYAADVLVRSDTIAFIGMVDTSQITVNHRIDAAEQVVTPGFVDTHAHGNPLKTPRLS